MQRIATCLPVFLLALTSLHGQEGTAAAAEEPIQIIDLSATLLEDAEGSIAARIATDFQSDAAYIQQFLEEAQKLEQSKGIPAPVVVAIAILESGGFSSYLFLEAQNPFGMKATKIWKGDTFSMWHEGEMTKFRLYPGAEGAVLDFSTFLHSRKWFRDALKCKGDVDCFLRGLDPGSKEPGYSMDPEWSNKVKALIARYGLDALSESE